MARGAGKAGFGAIRVTRWFLSWMDLGFYRDNTGFSQPVVPGDLIWVSPRVAHNYGPQEGHFWNEFFVVFDGPIFDLWESRKMFDVFRPVQHLEAALFGMERLTKVCQTSTRTANSATAAIIDLQSILLDLIALQSQDHRTG